MTETSAPAVTLVEFLEARLDEDERALRWTSAQGRWDATQEHPGQPGRIRHRPTGDVLGEFVHPADAEHAERWQPARVFTDIQVKRRVLTAWPDPSGAWSADQADAARAVKEQIYRLVALLYANHPAYNPDWRP